MAVGQVAGRAVVVSGGADHTVRVWDAATGTPISDHPPQDQRPLALPSNTDLSAAGYGLVVDAEIRMSNSVVFSSDFADGQQTMTLAIDGRVVGADQRVCLELVLTPETVAYLKEALL